MAPRGVLAPSPAPGRNGSLAWRAVANPGQLQMVTFELEVIGQDAQVRSPLPGGSGPPLVPPSAVPRVSRSSNAVWLAHHHNPRLCCTWSNLQLEVIGQETQMRFLRRKRK